MSRLLVIAMCVKNSDFIHNWASQIGVPYHLQPPSVKTNHNVGESISYFEYIVENYDKLADHTVFLDDAGPNHWHARHLHPSWLTMVKEARPDKFEAFGEQLSDGNLLSVVSQNMAQCEIGNCTASDELPCIKSLLQILGVQYDSFKHDPHAGNAFVVSRVSLRRIPLHRYSALVRIMRSWQVDPTCKSKKWGYALDRVKGVLWG